MSAPLNLTDAGTIARLVVIAAKVCEADPALVLNPPARIAPSSPVAVSSAAARRAIIRFLDALEGSGAARRFALARQWSGSGNAAAQMLSTARREIAPDHKALAALEAGFGCGPLAYRPSTRPRQLASQPAAQPPAAPQEPSRSEVIIKARQAGAVRKAEMELSLMRRKRPALADNKLKAARQHPGYDAQTRARIRTLLAKGVKDVKVRPQALQRFSADEALRRARSRARSLRGRGLSLAVIGVTIAQECGVHAGSAWLKDAVGEA